jgi:hypothetical protein
MKPVALFAFHGKLTGIGAALCGDRCSGCGNCASADKENARRAGLPGNPSCCAIRTNNFH